MENYRSERDREKYMRMKGEVKRMVREPKRRGNEERCACIAENFEVDKLG